MLRHITGALCKLAKYGVTAKNRGRTLVKTCYCYLQTTGRILANLTEEACGAAVRKVVVSRLDYANLLPIGVRESSLRRCQVVQSDAARMIARVSRRQHISPILQNLHWLSLMQATNHLETINADIHGTHIGDNPELHRGISASTEEGITIDNSPADHATNCHVCHDAIL